MIRDELITDNFSIVSDIKDSVEKIQHHQALAAVSVAFPIMSLMTAFGQVFGAGCAAAVGRALGAGKNDYANNLISTTVIIAISTGLIFMTVGFLWIEPIFRLFGTTDTVMPTALEYGYWMYIGAVFSIPNQSFNNIARAQTKAILSMKALSLGAISNIILDPIFMFELGGFGLNMGIRGASMATTVAQAIGFIYIGSHFISEKSGSPIRVKFFTLKDKILVDILRSGLPIGINQLLAVVAVSFTNIAANAYAPTELVAANFQSAYGLVLKINTIIFCCIMGYLQGYQPLASYCYGAKNKERFYECFYFALKAIVGFTFTLSIVSQFIAPHLVSVFTNNEEIIAMGTRFVRYNTIFLPLLGLTFFAMLTFQATGNAKQGGLIAISRQGVIFLPTLLIYSAAMGLDGIYFAQPTADVLTAIVGILLLMKFRTELETHFEEGLTA